MGKSRYLRSIVPVFHQGLRVGSDNVTHNMTVFWHVVHDMTVNAGSPAALRRASASKSLLLLFSAGGDFARRQRPSVIEH